MSTTAEARSVTLFAEDPGAVNCIAPVAQALIEQGFRVGLLSAGHATELLRARGLVPVALGSSAEAHAALVRGAPQWLVVGTSENPDSLAFVLIAAARKRGISSAGMLDSAANCAHRFRGRSASALTHAPDWLLVPDEFTAAEFAQLGFPRERVIVVGHPHAQHVKRFATAASGIDRATLRRNALPAVPENRMVLVFASELSTGLDPAQFQISDTYTLRGNGAATGRTEIVLEEVLDAIASLARDGIPRPYLVLRLHPKETSERLAAYRLEFDQVSSGGDVLPLLMAADVVVGMSSLLLAEAHALGVRTLAVLPRLMESDWLPAIRDGLVPCATDRRGIRQMLRKLLTTAVSVAPSPIPSAADDPNEGAVGRVIRFLAPRNVTSHRLGSSDG